MLLLFELRSALSSSQSSDHPHSSAVGVSSVVTCQEDMSREQLLVQRARKAFLSGKSKPLEFRIHQLNSLLRFISERRRDIADAVKRDLGKVHHSPVSAPTSQGSHCTNDKTASYCRTSASGYMLKCHPLFQYSASYKKHSSTQWEGIRSELDEQKDEKRNQMLVRHGTQPNPVIA